MGIGKSRSLPSFCVVMETRSSIDAVLQLRFASCSAEPSRDGTNTWKQSFSSRLCVDKREL